MYDEVETAPIRQLLELTNGDDLKARPGGGRTGGRKSVKSPALLHLQLLRFVRGMGYGEEAIIRKVCADKTRRISTAQSTGLHTSMEAHRKT